MKRILNSLLLILICNTALADAPEAEELTNMLNEFLAGASINDIEAHDRFWAEDLIYTSSAGLRFGKGAIVDRNAPPEEPLEEPSTVYSAEDIRIQQYGDTAIVAFRLVGKQAEPPEVMQFLNTGTFLKRDGVWQVVAWQATRMAEEDQESSQD